jgi:hypothetical protein
MAVRLSALRASRPLPPGRFLVLISVRGRVGPQGHSVAGRIFFFLFAPYGSMLPLLEHRVDFSVSWSFTDGRTPWTGDQLVARPLPKHRTTQTQKNPHTHQTSMPWVGFEPTIPASERAKTVHALDRSPTVTGTGRIRSIEKSSELIRNRTFDLPACSIVPQPTTLPRAPNKINVPE